MPSSPIPLYLLATVRPCEWKVLLLMADDVSRMTIADKLCISLKTVETYHTRIAGKLDLTGHRTLVSFARQNKAFLKCSYDRLHPLD